MIGVILMCNLAFIAARILNFGLAWTEVETWVGLASPKFKIVAAMNAKLHISPQSEENFLPMQTLKTHINRGESVYYFNLLS